MQQVFAPMLAVPLSIEDIYAFIVNSGYAFEQKVDGQRVVIVVENGKATVVGRKNVLVIDPEIVNAIESIKMDCVIDGELINGRYIIFDLPKAGSAVQLIDKYSIRRSALEVVAKQLSRLTNKIELLPSYIESGDKESLYRWCNANGTEGLVVKNLDSPYICGKRTEHWLKVKFVKTCEAFKIGRAHV